MRVKFVFLIALFALVGHSFGEFNLTVVHISDFHSHWFEFDENKHDCSKTESREGKCYGGFARLLTFVRDIRKREKNVVVLSSGEFFLGRSLNALHGWKPAHSLLPRLGIDAMSLSNHDFDSGIHELSAFLYSMEFPILCANMWARNTSYLYSRLNKSAVVDVNGTKVGIVGYVHRHALKKSKSAASIKFLPEIPALQEEVSRLESEGINKIIALGHAGYHTDLEIARNVNGVDIVIGGDSDVMLFDPGHDASESQKIGNIHGNYPRVHQHEPENDTELMNRTLVLHIPQHGMYVGVLRATFDDDGKIIHESGEPVLLDSSIPQDQDTLEFLTFAKGALEKIAEHMRLPDNSEILGQTSGHLHGNRRNCRMQECSLGNFVADAMLHEFTFHYRNNSEHVSRFEQWGPIDALVLNSGNMLRALEPGYIKIQDILKSLFLGEFITRVYMSGEQLLDMMEHSVKHYDHSGVTAPGAFLQISGLRVEYDLSQSPGKRVRRLAIRCRDCKDENTYHPIKAYKMYVIGMPTFLKYGGDGFFDFGDDETNEDMGQLDALLIVEYLRRMFYIEPKIDGRIKFYNFSEKSNNVSENVPLLFGEPATEKNKVDDLVTVPADEEKEIADISTKSPKTEAETVYGIGTFPNQETPYKEKMSDVVRNIPEQKNAGASETMLTEMNINTDALKNDSTSINLKNVTMVVSNDKQTEQRIEDNETQFVQENTNNSKNPEANEKSFATSLPEDEAQVNYTTAIEDLLKIFLESETESLSSTLENLVNNTQNFSRISDLLGKVSLAINSSVKRRSVEDWMEKNKNWTSSLESKNLQSDVLDSGSKIITESLLTGESSLENDIRMVLVSILKDFAGEDFMKMLTLSNVNITTSGETNY